MSGEWKDRIMNTETGEIIRQPTAEQKAASRMLEVTEEEAKFMEQFPEDERFARLALREELKDKKYDNVTRARVTNHCINMFNLGLDFGREGK